MGAVYDCEGSVLRAPHRHLWRAVGHTCGTKPLATTRPDPRQSPHCLVAWHFSRHALTKAGVGDLRHVAAWRPAGYNPAIRVEPTTEYSLPLSTAGALHKAAHVLTECPLMVEAHVLHDAGACCSLNSQGRRLAPFQACAARLVQSKGEPQLTKERTAAPLGVMRSPLPVLLQGLMQEGASPCVHSFPARVFLILVVQPANAEPPAWLHGIRIGVPVQYAGPIALCQPASSVRSRFWSVARWVTRVCFLSCSAFSEPEWCYVVTREALR